MMMKKPLKMSTLNPMHVWTCMNSYNQMLDFSLKDPTPLTCIQIT